MRVIDPENLHDAKHPLRSITTSHRGGGGSSAPAPERNGCTDSDE
jgi:hypothetical protein